MIQKKTENAESGGMNLTKKKELFKNKKSSKAAKRERRFVQESRKKVTSINFQPFIIKPPLKENEMNFKTWQHPETNETRIYVS